MPAAAQDFTISATGNCAGTPAHCGTSGNRNGDRDTSWPDLQLDEGDVLTFTVQANNVPSGATGQWLAVVDASGGAYNTSDLRLSNGSPLILASSQLGFSSIFPIASRTDDYFVYSDGAAEPDETITFSISAVTLPTTGTIDTSSSVTVTIRGTDSAPSFGSGSVSNKTYIAGQAITEFQVPVATGGNGTITYAASNLPTGLRFDATGSASPGCPGTEAREICGTPTAAAATVTSTASDSNNAASDRDTLTFIVTVNADSAPDFGSGAVSNRTYVAGLAITDFQVPAATDGNGTITHTATGLPTGLRFDASGTDSPGCLGNQAREICGTPTTAAAATTVTITATNTCCAISRTCSSFISHLLPGPLPEYYMGSETAPGTDVRLLEPADGPFRRGHVS